MASTNRPLITYGDNLQIGTYNDVRGDQIITNFYFMSPSTSSAADPISQASVTPRFARFNDVPLDMLSGDFTGREQEIALITQSFEVQRGDIPSRCAIYGMRGVGKSQASYALAKDLFDQGRFTNIFYVQASSDEKLLQGFSHLLHLVSHPDRFAREPDARLTAARRWLEDFDAGRWLLVIDSITLETVEFIRQHLPRRNRNGSILFVTLTENVAKALTRVAGEQHGMVEFRLPDIHDAAKLFVKLIDDDGASVDPSKIQEVVKGVGCLPLAIAQVAEFMSDARITLEDMLAILKSERKIDVRFPLHIPLCLKTNLTTKGDPLGESSLEVPGEVDRIRFPAPTSEPRATITGSHQSSEDYGILEYRLHLHRALHNGRSCYCRFLPAHCSTCRRTSFAEEPLCYPQNKEETAPYGT